MNLILFTAIFLIAFNRCLVEAANENETKTPHDHWDTVSDDILRKIMQQLNGSEIAHFTRVNRHARRVVSNSHYAQNPGHSVAFTAHQYTLIRRFNSSYENYKIMTVSDLNAIREIFKGTEKFPDGKEKMSLRIKKLIPTFAHPMYFFFAMLNDDVYKVKLFIDYFGYANIENWFELASFTKSMPNLSRFYKNSLELLKMQNNDDTSVEDFVNFYTNVRDIASLNIVQLNVENIGPGEQFLINRFSGLSERDIDLYQFILDQGPEYDVNQVIYGSTRLLNCFTKGGFNKKLAKLLKQYPNVDINKQTSSGDTALMKYSSYSNANVNDLELLLSFPNIQVNLQNLDGDSALHLALTNRKEGLAKQILRRSDVDVNLINNKGVTVLMLAVKRSSEELVIQILQKAKLNLILNAKDSQGYSALMYAVKFKLENIAKILLSQPQIDVSTTNENGRSLLNYAIQFKMNEVARLINAKSNRYLPYLWW